MRQIQKPALSQKLALTQAMRSSLELLEMGPAEIAKAVQREESRNAFLCSIPPSGSSPGNADGVTENVFLESALDDIARQIGLIRMSAQQAELSHGLLHSLDERGFLPDSLDDMANYLGSTKGDIEKILPVLKRNVEPAGLFATSLRECFQLQLEAKNRFDPLMEKLLGRLDLIAKRDIEAICTECGVDEEDAFDMLKDIRGLDPAPLVERRVTPQYQAAPEIIIRENVQGDLHVELNEAALPRVLTDDALFSTTLAIETDGHAQSYYRDCYRGAAHMVRAMQKRANTLLATGKAIAEKQDKFIRTGRDRSKVPLTIEQISWQIGVNKSTISRALKSCSIRTPQGTFPAKQFLARGLTPHQQGGKIRPQALRRLSLLVKTEDARQPNSDAQLMQRMATLGFKISRRTVAKYRQLLGIPGAYHRRKR